jgi:hypothetical protein
LFRLAALLRRSVRELLDTVDSFEILEWQEYWQLEPWGDDWEQTATICEAIFHAAGYTDGVDRNRWRPVPREKPPQSKQSMAAEMAKIKAFADAAKRAKQQQQPPPEAE